MTPNLSIIIPAYNAMPYLKECLDSIYTQGVNEDIFEVVVVDDGSTDDTGSYCDQYASNHANLTVIHTENSGGCSRPRNIALKVARGDYVFFCDADDFLCPESLQGMMDHAAETGCDVGLFKIDRTDWNAGDYRGLFDKSLCNIPSNYPPLASFFGAYRLIKRTLLIENGITFNEGHLQEDWCFTLQCYLKARNICTFTDRYYYKYRRRDDGNSLSMANLKSITSDWPRTLVMFKDYLKLCKENDVTPESHPWIYRRTFKEALHLIRFALQNADSEPMLTQFRSILLPVFSDQVRCYLPFGNLLAVDAFMDGCSAGTLRAILHINLNELDVRFSQNQNGELYYILSSSEREGLERTVRFPQPQEENYGPELLNPAFNKACITEAALNEEGLGMHGSAFCLKRTAADFSCGRISFRDKAGDERLVADLEMEDLEASLLYDEVSYAHFAWSTSIPLQEFAQTNWKNIAELQPFFEFSWVDGKKTENRLGHTHTSISFEKYQGKRISMPTGILEGRLTNADNLTLAYLRPECRIQSLNWKGSLLSMNGTLRAQNAGASGVKGFVVLQDSTGQGRPVSFPVEVTSANGSGALESLWSVKIDLHELIKRGFGRKWPFSKKVESSAWEFALLLQSKSGSQEIRFGYQRPKGTLSLFKQGEQTIGRYRITPTQTSDHYLNFTIEYSADADRK